MEIEKQVYNFFLKKYKYVYDEVMSMRQDFSNESKVIKDILDRNVNTQKCFEKYSHWFSSEHDFPFDKNVYQMSIKAGELEHSKTTWLDDMMQISHKVAMLKFDAMFSQSRDILWFLIRIHLGIEQIKYGKMHRALELLLLLETDLEYGVFMPEAMQKIFQHFISSASSYQSGEIRNPKCKKDSVIIRRCQNDTNLEGLRGLMKTLNCSGTEEMSPLCKINLDLAKLFNSFKILDMSVAMLKMSLDGQNECVEEWLLVCLKDSAPITSIPTLFFDLKNIFSQYHEFIIEQNDVYPKSYALWKKCDSTMWNLRDILGHTIIKVFKKQVNPGMKVDDHECLYNFFSTDHWMTFIAPSVKSDTTLLSKAVNLMRMHAFDKISELFINVVGYNFPERSSYDPDNLSPEFKKRCKLGAVQKHEGCQPENDLFSDANSSPTPNTSNQKEFIYMTFNPACASTSSLQDDHNKVEDQEKLNERPYLIKDSSNGTTENYKKGRFDYRSIKPVSSKWKSNKKVTSASSSTFNRTIPFATVTVNKPTVLYPNSVTKDCGIASNSGRASQEANDNTVQSSPVEQSDSSLTHKNLSLFDLEHCFTEALDSAFYRDNFFKAQAGISEKIELSKHQLYNNISISDKKVTSKKDILVHKCLPESSSSSVLLPTVKTDVPINTRLNQTSPVKQVDSSVSCKESLRSGLQRDFIKALVFADASAEIPDDEFPEMAGNSISVESNKDYFKALAVGIDPENFTKAYAKIPDKNDISKPSDNNISVIKNVKSKTDISGNECKEETSLSIGSTSLVPAVKIDVPINNTCSNQISPVEQLDTSLHSKKLSHSDLEHNFIKAFEFVNALDENELSKLADDNIKMIEKNVRSKIGILEKESKTKFSSSVSYTILPPENEGDVPLILLPENPGQCKVKVYHDDEIPKVAKNISCTDTITDNISSDQSDYESSSDQSNDESSSEDSFVKVSYADIEDAML